MNEIIRIEDRDGKQTANARDLWEFLEVQTRFNDWILRYIKDFNFQENQDFVVFTQNSVKGRPSVEYHISLGMAKELSMLQRNAKGKEARLYFIVCEEKLRMDIPKTLPEALRAYATTLEEKEKLLIEQKENKPKVDYFNDVSDATSVHSLNVAAKLLRWGRNTLMKRLRHDGVLTDSNVPYQKHISNGRFVVKERRFPVGSATRLASTTFVTGKGMQWLQGRYTKQLKLWGTHEQSTN